MLSVGSRVFWEDKTTAALGTIVQVVPNADGNFSYDVDFGSKVRRVPGSELREICSRPTSACEEKESLLSEYRQAFETYMQALRELVDAVGLMAHAEFEFLHRRLQDTREVARAARDRLDEHTFQHHC